MEHKRLAVSTEDLTRLADDLDDMQDHLRKQLHRLNTMVDTAEKGWRSPAAATYRDLQHSVNDDVSTVRQMLIFIAEAVRMSRDGFSAQELETLEHFRKLQQSVEGRQRLLEMADTGAHEPPATVPRSRLADL